MIDHRLDREHLARHFVSAGIRHFPASDGDVARKWVPSRL
jgi:hypothetical protein